MSVLRFVNATQNSFPRLAIFKKNFGTPSLGLIAWQVVIPTPGGTCEIEVPTMSEVYISTDPEDPYRGCRSRTLVVHGTSAAFDVVARPSDDGQDYVPFLMEQPGRPQNEVTIANHFHRGVWGHLLGSGKELYRPQDGEPQRDPAGRRAPGVLVTHVTEFVRAGSQLLEAMVTSTAVQILPSQTMTITGSRYDGFILGVT